MHIGLLNFSHLTNRCDTPLKERFEEAARDLGHELTHIHEPHLSFLDDEILHDSQQLPALDVIIARPNFIEEPSLRTYAIEKLRQRVPLINGHANIAATKNKIAQHLIFNRERIPCPHWGLARSASAVSTIAQRLGYPVIIKVAFGTHGKGVFYAENLETLAPIAEYLAIRDGNPMIVEEFVDEAQRSDLRIFLIGGKVVAAMQRQAPEGDVRANTSTGGTGAIVKLSKEEIDLAQRAAATFNLDIAGVDIIRSTRGPLILEVNSNPGFIELERVTGTAIAHEIITFASRFSST